MKKRNIVGFKAKIDSIIKHVNKNVSDYGERGNYAKYLTILVSGYIEIYLRYMVAEHARNASSPTVANFVEKNMNRFMNPNFDKITELLSKFSSDWLDYAISNTTESEVAAINSIVSNRNNIAHGQSSSISFVQVCDYYQKTTAALERLNGKINPN